MISADAQQGFERIFAKSVRANLCLTVADECQIEPLTGAVGNAPAVGHVLVLTITSLLFRLVVVFHVKEDQALREYFFRDEGRRDFTEFFSELINLCCGSINRELAAHFAHTGMSTPEILGAASLSSLPALAPTWVGRYGITINDSVRLHAMLCVFAYAPLDFSVAHETQLAETGELELF